jgi:hypothetical protein
MGRGEGEQGAGEILWLPVFLVRHGFAHVRALVGADEDLIVSRYVSWTRDLRFVEQLIRIRMKETIYQSGVFN